MSTDEALRQLVQAVRQYQNNPKSAFMWTQVKNATLRAEAALESVTGVVDRGDDCIALGTGSRAT